MQLEIRNENSLKTMKFQFSLVNGTSKGTAHDRIGECSGRTSCCDVQPSDSSLIAAVRSDLGYWVSGRFDGRLCPGLAQYAGTLASNLLRVNQWHPSASALPYFVWHQRSLLHGSIQKGRFWLILPRTL